MHKPNDSPGNSASPEAGQGCSGCPSLYLHGGQEFHRAGPLLVPLSPTLGSLLSSRSLPGLEGEGENKAWLLSIRFIQSKFIQFINSRTGTYWTAEYNCIEKLYGKNSSSNLRSWNYRIINVGKDLPDLPAQPVPSPLAFTKYLFLEQFLLQLWEFVFTISICKASLLFRYFFQHHFWELARPNLHELEKKMHFVVFLFL